MLIISSSINNKLRSLKSTTSIIGITEAGGAISLQRKDFKRTDSIGHVVEGIQMKVVDLSTGGVLGSNQEGELCFKLDFMMLGYYKNPEEFKTIMDDEGTGKKNKMFHRTIDDPFFLM